MDELKKYEITQGGRTYPPILTRIKDETTGDPFDLTLVTAITCCFKKTDGTELVLSVGSGIAIYGNPLLGKVQISLSSAQTALLEPVDGAELELSIVISSGDPVKVKILRAYSVIASDC